MWWIGLIVGIGAALIVGGTAAYHIYRRKKHKGGCDCTGCLRVSCPYASAAAPKEVSSSADQKAD
ncbi:MAG: hypothetical protein LBH24_06595 [Clostridiales bacterium]|jgi:hypothetical protein|nr:hypothetical protein [Clostridiales bacterium]